MSEELVTVDEQETIELLSLPGDDDSSPAEAIGELFPYVGFRGAKAKNHLAELDASNVGVNEFFLVDAAGYRRLKPFEYHLLKYYRTYAKQNTAGQVVKTSHVITPDMRGPGGWREHLVGLVAVYIAGNQTLQLPPVLQLATLRLHNQMCKAMNRAIQVAEKDAKDAKVWAARSPQAATSAAAVLPGGRFRVTAWGSLKSFDGADGTVEFNDGGCSIRATPESEVKLFNDLVGNMSLLIPAAKAYQKQVDFLKARLVRSEG